MNAILLIALASVGFGNASLEIRRSYHEEIGIPLAENIKAREEFILKNNVDLLNNTKIVGGNIAPANAHPYLAGTLISFVNLPGTSACGASLLTPDRLVTAAHCWFDGFNQASQIVVVLGTNFLFSGGIRIATSQVLMHPEWDPWYFANDIAMIYLPTSVSLSANIQTIALPNWSDLNDLFVGQWAMAAGYGVTADWQQGVSFNQMISQVNLQVITVAQCTAVFGSTFVRDSNICTNGAGGVGICRGDSGGPLVVIRNGRPTLIGISSFVARAGCELGHPSAFARVTSYYGFIIHHL